MQLQPGALLLPGDQQLLQRVQQELVQQGQVQPEVQLDAVQLSVEGHAELMLADLQVWVQPEQLLWQAAGLEG